MTSHKGAHSVTETLGVIYTISPNYRPPESLVTHSHKDLRSQPHIRSHSLAVSHTPANMVMQSQRHTVTQWQFYHLTHSLIQPPSHIQSYTLLDILQTWFHWVTKVYIVIYTVSHNCRAMECHTHHNVTPANMVTHKHYRHTESIIPCQTQSHTVAKQHKVTWYHTLRITNSQSQTCGIQVALHIHWFCILGLCMEADWSKMFGEKNKK